MARSLSFAWVGLVGLVAACGKPTTLFDGAPPPDANMVDMEVPDTTAPDTTIALQPPALTNVATAHFEFQSTEDGSFRCQLDSQAPYTCDAKTDILVTEGAHTLSVAAIDAAGNVDPSPATATWTVDLTPPDTTITRNPPPVDNSVDVAFEFTATETPATFECRLDGAAYAPCTSPAPVTGLTDGGHTFDVRAIDAAGNTDPTPAEYAWTVDTSTPDTVIDSGPTGAVQATDATFTFHSPNAGPGATFKCGLDGAPLAPCSMTWSTSGLAEMDHTFTVQVTNAAGTSDPTPAQRTWTVDHTAPTVQITGGPSGPTSVATPSFPFTTAGNPTVIECAVDAGAFAACTSPFTAAALGDGPHTVTVRATDAAGNRGSDSRAFTVDTMPPTVTITSGPSSPTKQTGAAFAFTASEAGVAYRCALDGSAFAACASGQSYATLADGAHSFQVEATDAAGNAGPAASWTWTVDTVGATVALDAPLPANPTNATTAAFAFHSASDPSATFACAIDGGAFAACTSGKTYTGLAGGAGTSHTFAVRATDAAGNTGAPASFTWTIDTQAPTVALDAPLPADPTSATAAAFAFHSADGGATFECALDGAPFASCASGKTYTGLAGGTGTSHTFAVRATDAAGNTGAATSFTWTIDTVGPTVALDTTPPAITNATSASFAFHSADGGVSFACALDSGAFAACNGGTASYATLTGGAGTPHTFAVKATDAAGNTGAATTFTWTIDTQGPTVALDTTPPALTSSTAASFAFHSADGGVSFACALDGGAFASCVTGKTYTSLAGGAGTSHTFKVEATDAAGNTGNATTFAWTIDTQPPTVVLDAPLPADPTSATTAAFAFHSADGGVGFACSIDNGAFATCATGKTYTNLAGGAGTSHTFAVEATDAAGNTGNATTFTWTIDTQGPTVALDTTPPALTSSTAATFAFHSADGGVSFACSLDNGAFATCASGVSYPGLAGGAGTSHTFAVKATDAAGNTGNATTYAWTIDTQPPTVALDAPLPANPTNATAAAFAFHSADGGIAYQCSIDGGAFAACASGKTYTGLAGGAGTSHTFAVKATDAAGNTGAATTYTWTIDTTGPTVALDAPLPANPTSAIVAAFAFHSADGGVSFACSLDGSAFATCASGVTYTGLAGGAGTSHTFKVQATDTAGNTGNPTTFTWTIDTQGATVAIDSTPPSLTNATSAAFTFHSPSDATATYECSLDGSAYASCASGKTYSGLAGGTGTSHTFAVHALDPLGNVGAPQSYTWTIDTSPPTVTITGGPSGPTSNSVPTFTFTTAGNPTTTQCRIGATAGTGTFAACVGSFTSTNLADGSYVFEVQVADGAGNSSNATRSFTVDTIAPTVTITGGPSGTTNNKTPTFTFTTAGNPTTTQCRIGATQGTGTFVACSGSYTPAALADGSYVFEVQVQDAAGNTGNATRSFTVDTRVTITGAASPATAATIAASVNGTPCTGGACLVAPGTIVHLAAAPNVGWSFTGWSGTPAGCTGTAAAVDVTAGTASATCTASYTALTVTLTAMPASDTPLTTSHFAWTTSAAVTGVRCSLDGAAFAACAGGALDYASTGPGTHTFKIFGVDAAGAQSATTTYPWITHVDDGHVVLMGHDFHGVTAPYSSTKQVQMLLVNAIKLARPSPTTGNIEILIDAVPSGSLGATEIANIKAAALAGSSSFHFTDLAATDVQSFTDALVGRSVLIIPDQSGGNADALGQAWAQPLRDFVYRGGVVIVMDGFDAAGTPSLTGTILNDAGLLDYDPYAKQVTGQKTIIAPDESTPLTTGLDNQTYGYSDAIETFDTDGVVIAGVYTMQCTKGAFCPNTAVAHKTFHLVEGFDYPATGSWPWFPWTAATPATITLAASAAHDDGRGATGPTASTFDGMAWAWRPDPVPPSGSTTIAWVRFTDPGNPTSSSYAGVGIGASVQSSWVGIVQVQNGMASVHVGSVAFGAAPHFTEDPNNGGWTPAAINYGDWYQVRVRANDYAITVDLVNQWGGIETEASYNPQLVRPTGGVAFGVSAGASLDSIQYVDSYEQSAFVGSDSTTVQGTSFTLQCPDGQVMTGMSGGAAEAIDRISTLHCGVIVHDTSAAGYHVQAMPDATTGGGGSGGSAFDQTCPAGSVVTAIKSGVGTYTYTTLYSLTLTCTAYSLTGAPGTYRLVPTQSSDLPQIGTGHSGVPLTFSTFAAHPNHALTQIIGYYGPWPIFTGFTVVNGGYFLADRPYLIY